MAQINDDGAAAYYQGMKLLTLSFSIAPGMNADSGTATVLIKNFDGVNVQISRPMFGKKLPPLPNLTINPSIIDGSGFTLRQAGILDLHDDEGILAYADVYIRDDGIQELDRFQAADGAIVSLVQLELVDEREWWSRRGYVFGVFNKRGADEKVIDVTMNPDTKLPWTLEELLKHATDLLPSRRVVFDKIYGAPVGGARIPKDKSPHFTNPANFIDELLAEYGTLIPVKTIDGKLKVYQKGIGRSLDDVRGEIGFRPYKELTTLSTNYIPDAITCYAEHPTITEASLQISGTRMVLPDPTTGEAQIYTDVLPKYGMTPRDLAQFSAKLRGFGHQNAPAYKFAKSRIVKYLIATGGRDMPPAISQSNIVIPGVDPTGVKSPNGFLLPSPDLQIGTTRAYEQEALRRCGLLAEHANRSYWISESDFPKIPFLDRLIETNATTKEPLPIRVRLTNYATTTVNPSEDAKASAQAEGGLPPESVTYFINPDVLDDRTEGPNTFRFESRTGIIKFAKPVGMMYYPDTDSGNLAKFPARPRKISIAGNAESIWGAVAQQLYLMPPEQIYLLIAYEKHGTRDLRAGPGSRQKFPEAVAKINLQYTSSPEDYFLKSFDKNGATMDNDTADTLFPAMQQIPGRKYEPLLPDDGGVTSIRNEEFADDSSKFVKTKLLSDDRIAGRKIEVVGFVPLDPDGVVTHVSWNMGADGIPHTTILMGSTRAQASGPNFAQKNLSMRINTGLSPESGGPGNKDVVT